MGEVVASGGAAGPPPSAARRGPALPLAILVTAVVALNIRPGVTTVGPVLDSITGHFGAGSSAAGVITAAPVIAFAGVSLAAPLLLARVTLRTGLIAALALLGASLALRPWAGLAAFVATTVTAAIGMGLITVLLPALIRTIGGTAALVTTFTTALQAGAALGFATVVPLADATGWQVALTLWALLTPLGILALWRRTGARSETTVRQQNPLRTLRETGSTWLALFFGLQALVAFVVMGWLPSLLQDAGVSAAASGAYLGILTCVGVPVSLTVPALVARSAHPSRWLAGFSGFTVLGLTGFLLAPAAAPLLWAVILGAGLSVFSLALTVITVRAGSVEQAVRLSAAVQGIGYLIAAVGPYAIGVFRHLADGWTLPLLALLAVAAAQLGAGLLSGDRRAPAPTAPAPEKETVP